MKIPEFRKLDGNSQYSSYEPYIHLAETIVRSEMESYRSALRRLSREWNFADAINDVKRHEKLLLSDYYQRLTLGVADMRAVIAHEREEAGL